MINPTSLVPARFDRDLPLAELLRAVSRTKLEATLGGTVGQTWRIVDRDGAVIWPDPSCAGAKAGDGEPEFSARLVVDIDIVGHLIVPSTREKHARVAAGWLEMVLTSAARYRMAADLHLETVHADYEALQKKHAALQESEARYRALSGELEERVRAQVMLIETAHRRLFQAEKMASVGSLAAGMAHEINNPIGFIRSNLTTASSYLGTLAMALNSLRADIRSTAGSSGTSGTSGALATPAGIDALWREADLEFVLTDFEGLVTESMGGADRIAGIVGKLKTFSRIDHATGVDVDLNEAIRAASALIADQLPEQIRVEMDLHDLPLLACDPGKINQVLFSLLQNAGQAIGTAPGTIRIASRSVGDTIQVTVNDDGCGIAADKICRIFDPFFTTRDVGHGMGLGLTIASDIVAAYRGRLEVDSTAGAGSTFRLIFPLPGTLS